MKKIYISLAVALAFSACSLKPSLPKVDTHFKSMEKNVSISTQWWRDFNDENLNIIVDKALENNTNLQVANLNMQLALKNANLIQKDFFPNFSLKSSASRDKKASRYANSYTLGAMLNYELDLWGRVSNASKSAKANFKASKFDMQTARLSIISEVLKSYFTLIAFHQEEKIVRLNMQNFYESMNLQKSKFEEGAISRLVYLQSVAQYQSAKVQLSSVLKNIALSQSGLAYLTGAKLDEIIKLDFAIATNLPNLPEIPSNISADILTHRSDVASALEKLKSANFMVGVARAAYFPKLSLTGLFGFANNELDHFLNSSANTWSIAGNLAMPLVDFGRTSTNVDIAKIRENIMVKNYEQTLKTALFEVQTALKKKQYSDESVEHLKTLVESQEKIYKLSNDMYNAGYIAHLELLDAQRHLLSAQTSLVEARLAQILSIVDTYKAFGGGFNGEL